MNHMLAASIVPVGLLSLLVLLALPPAAASAQEAARSERASSGASGASGSGWVNPLPEGSPASLSHHVLASQAVGEGVGYVVFLPPSYEAQAERRYPVIYFLHGAGGTESADAAGFSGHAARAMAAGTLPESIIVFPNGRRSGYRGEVERMIVDELIPHIDATYATLPGPAGRAVAGFSMGGAGGVRLALAHPDLFTAAVSLGGGIGNRNGEGGEPTLELARQNASTLRANGFALFVVNGDQDRPDAFDRVVELFKGIDLPITQVILPDTRHNLGHYYERSGAQALAFLGEQLEAALPEGE